MHNYKIVEKSRKAKAGEVAILTRSKLKILPRYLKNENENSINEIVGCNVSIYKATIDLCLYIVHKTQKKRTSKYLEGCI